MEEIIKNLSNISLLIPSVIPTTFFWLGLKKMIKVVYMEKYELFDEMIQQRLFIKYMEDDLLNKTLYILRQEKNKRLKIKINNFLKFNLFSIHD